MRYFTLSVAATLVVGLLVAEASAQNVFIRRGNISSDALALEHAVKKLASHDTQMATLNAALKDLGDQSQKFTWLAQRQGSYYALQRAFDLIIQRYKVVEYTIDSASDWQPGNPRMQEWRTVQTRFDQVYYDLYGYDLLDPYFGRHPDFAAVPIQPQIPMRVLHPQQSTWSIPDYTTGKIVLPPAPSSPGETIRLRGNPQQF